MAIMPIGNLLDCHGVGHIQIQSSILKQRLHLTVNLLLDKGWQIRIPLLMDSVPRPAPLC